MGRPKRLEASGELTKRYGAIWLEVFSALAPSHNKRAAALGAPMSNLVAKARGRTMPSITERVLLCAVLADFEGRPEELKKFLEAGLERMRREEGAAK